jgi:hypothetical protein
MGFRCSLAQGRNVNAIRIALHFVSAMVKELETRQFFRLTRRPMRRYWEGKFPVKEVSKGQESEPKPSSRNWAVNGKTRHV